MATYTDYFSLKRPSGAESVLRTDINNNTTKIDLVMHQNRQMSADAYDTTETYNTGDIVIYENMLYRCNADNITGNWDSTKWENTTLAAEIVASGGTAPDLTGVCGEAYDPTETYAVGDLVIYDNVLYKCNTANTTGTWDSTKWDSTTLAYEIMNGGGGGGSSTLAGLNDVDITTPSDGQLLIYDDANDEWVNGNIAGVNVQPVIYSTDEREVGVWIDGRPLYEKTFSATSSSSTSTAAILAETGVGTEIVDFFGIINGARNIISTLDANQWSYSWIAANKYQLANFAKGTSYAGLPTVTTCRYIKTADTPGSGTWTPSGVPAVHYDGNEKVVGTWFGETLYERTIIKSINNMTQNTLYDIETLSNVDIVVSITSGFRYVINDTPAVDQYENQHFGRVIYDKKDSKIKAAQNITAQTTNRTYTFIITIRYTKTTS